QNWTTDQTIARKFKELILAVELEREYSKDDILTGYLNIAPYGNIQYGVETGARDYFGKGAKDLTLPEAAMLAAIPQAPSYYSPYGPIYDSGALIGRQHYILDQMVKQKMITKAQAEEAKAYDILATIKASTPKYEGIKAPYFVLAAKEELEEKYGAATVQRGGWKVTTTLNMDLQNLAEQQVSKGIAQVKRQGGDVAAFAAIDVKTAQMVALVGGPDFTNPEYGQVNYAREKLPPGSTFKPYDYLSLINETTNTGAGSVLYDTQAPLPGYPCTNKAKPKDGGNCLTDYDFRFPGPVTVRYALGGSRNIPAVKAMLTVGVNKTISIAESMGLVSGYNCYEDENLTKESQCYGSSAIGDGAYLRLDEHVNGFATISRLGSYVPKTYILKITDSSGKTIDEWKQPQGKQVVKQDSAYIVTDILSDPNASYLRTDRKYHRYKGWNFAIKTGTTNDAKDGLMMSYSTQYAAGVWVGYHNRTIAMNGAMENMTQPILRGWMQTAHDNLKPVNWTKPSDTQTLPAYVIRSKLSNLGEIIPSPSTDIYPAWYKQSSKFGSNKTMDKVSGKIATSCTPDLAKDDNNNANDNVFSADIFVGANSSSASGEDDVHKCGDTPPAITLQSQNNGNGTWTFTATVTQGTHPISSDKFLGTVKLYVNGIEVASQGVTSSPAVLSFPYTVTATGEATVRAEVIDSVLYSASESAAVTFTTGSIGTGTGTVYTEEP
ncbi:MAG TPA: transglycosylase domain-containing protein, partial [Candidatus Saccharimonadales bacterium]